MLLSLEVMFGKSRAARRWVQVQCSYILSTYNLRNFLHLRTLYTNCYLFLGKYKMQALIVICSSLPTKQQNIKLFSDHLSLPWKPCNNVLLKCMESICSGVKLAAQSSCGILKFSLKHFSQGPINDADNFCKLHISRLLELLPYISLKGCKK